jgi:hypothetical protein
LRPKKSVAGSAGLPSRVAQAQTKATHARLANAVNDLTSQTAAVTLTQPSGRLASVNRGP